MNYTVQRKKFDIDGLGDNNGKIPVNDLCRQVLVIYYPFPYLSSTLDLIVECINSSWIDMRMFSPP